MCVRRSPEDESCLLVSTVNKTLSQSFENLLDDNNFGLVHVNRILTKDIACIIIISLVFLFDVSQFSYSLMCLFKKINYSNTISLIPFFTSSQSIRPFQAVP